MSDDRSPLVSIILVNYNGIAVIDPCLRSLQHFLHSVPYEVIIVDNCSTDGSAEFIEHHFPQFHLLRQTVNHGFGTGNNIGARMATGEFLLLLNTDTQLISDILLPLILLMKQHPEAGIIGPKLLNPDGSLQLSTAWAVSWKGEFKTRQRLKQYENPTHQRSILQRFEQCHEVDVVVGAALFIRKKLFDQLGGFDEQFFMYFEESDLCRRAQMLGWKILYTPEVSVIHVRGHSTDQISARMMIEYRRSQLYYYLKHRPLWEQICLRLYLLVKFAIATLRSPHSTPPQLFQVLLNFRHYPLKGPR
jgi:GT2 family glycosyltransferase